MTQSDSQQLQDRMEKGLLHLQCLNYVEALACFNQVLRLNPSHPEAWSKSGTVLEKLGCYREAIAVNQTVQHLLMKPGLSLEPPALHENPAVLAANQALQSTSQYWLNRGATLYTLGHDADAITSYDNAIELDPTNHSAWSNRCLALYYLGHYDQALASYDKVIEIKPDDYHAWTGRAHALVGLDRYEAAIVSYNKALEIQPDYSEAITHRTIALDHIDSLKNKLSKDETVVDFEVNLNNGALNGQAKLVPEVQVSESKSEPEPTLVNEPEPFSPEAFPNEEIAAENYQDYFWRGNECYALGQYEAAIINYGKTVELKPDYHKAWYNRGISLSKLGQHEDAVFSYDQALEIQPDKHQAWFHRGVALSELGQIEAAIASYDKALELKIDYPEAWANRGTLLVNLIPPDESSSPEEDITVPDLKGFAFATENELNGISIPESVSKTSLENYALSADLSVAQTSNSQPLSDLDLSTFSHEIDSPTFIPETIETEVQSFEHSNGYDIDPPTFIPETIETEVQSFEHSNGHTENLVEIAEPSVLYPEIKLKIEPEIEPEMGTISDLVGTNGFGKLDEMPISHDDIALGLVQNDSEEWDDFGETLPESEEMAIASHKTLIPHSQDQQWMVWEYQGLQALCNQNPRAAYRLWEQGIEILTSDHSDQRYGCGQLYLRKGRTQYTEACKQPNPIPEWITARDTFLNALDYFIFSDFPEQHLETLQELLRVCHLLADTYAIEQILPQGSATLVSLLQNPNLTRRQKVALESKFAGFVQLQVDVIAQYSPSQALELAESTKNHRLGRFRKGWSYQTDQLQQQLQTLLTPGTAAIFWYLSPAALTTFVLKPNQPPVIVQSFLRNLDQVQHPELQDYPPATYQLRRFEEWMQLWKQSYQQYCDLDSESAQYAPWRQNMEPMLYLQLRKILEINRICADYLQDVDHVILIPHRDLHFVPLHTLFPGRFMLSYLPSLQLGIDLQQCPDVPIQRLLSVEGPTSNPAQTESSDLVFHQLQSAVIAHLYGTVRSLAIPSQEATQSKVVSALKMMSGCFHFAGESNHDLETVQKSGLALTEEVALTLDDILRLDLSRYALVCLTAGQTGITNDQSILDDEYLSLTSGFLSAGVTYIVNTLWPVDEAVSSLLMIQFHQLLLQKIAPIQALRSAQNWLSTLTYGQLSEWYRNLAKQINHSNPSAANGARLNALAQAAANEPEPNDMPYAHPFYWAGFTITGKVPETIPEKS